MAAFVLTNIKRILPIDNTYRGGGLMRTARLLFLYLFFSISIACSSNPKPQTNPLSPEGKPPEPITLKVYPLNSFEGTNGATVWVDYKIARHPGNRSYFINWGDELGELGGTGRSLDGDKEPYTFPRMFVQYLYQGRYEIRLILIQIEDGRAKEYRASEKFSVQ